MTLQTLHPTRFDCGKILAQTPPFKFGTPFPESSTVPDLMKHVAPKGAELLVDSIKKGLFVPEEGNPDIIPNEQATKCRRRAPKITPEDRHIKWDTWSADEIIRRHRVIGPLWNTANTYSDGKVTEKRLIWVSGFSRSPTPLHRSLLLRGPGIPFVEQPLDSDMPGLAVTTCDGAVLRIEKAKVEGGKTQDAYHAVRRTGILGNDNLLHIPNGFQSAILK